MSVDGQSVGSGIGRRSVLAGAAWSVPVAMVAIATPAVAASGVTVDMVWGNSVDSQGGYQINDDAAPVEHALYLSGERLFTFTPSGGDLPAGTVINLSSARIDGGSLQAPALVFSAVSGTDVTVGPMGASTVQVTLTAPVLAGESRSLQVDMQYATTVLPDGLVWIAVPVYSVTATVGGQSGFDNGYWRGTDDAYLVTRYGTVFGYGSI